jgi:hypothetical protein
VAVHSHLLRNVLIGVGISAGLGIGLGIAETRGGNAPPKPVGGCNPNNPDNC